RKTVHKAVNKPSKAIACPGGGFAWFINRLVYGQRQMCIRDSPYSSHERGTNENFNGLLREYVPKGISLNPLTSEELDNDITAINERLRRLLQ
ncbi:hypothetical protein O2F39_14010, partial [Lacticaseibacillus rhamnosus]|nr:hypothetical protein [Lacticaseibacillus rhamnosus]